MTSARQDFGPTVMRITAIGEDAVLGKAISHNGVPIEHYTEGLWTFAYRDWKVVGSHES